MEGGILGILALEGSILVIYLLKRKHPTNFQWNKALHVDAQEERKRSAESERIRIFFYTDVGGDVRAEVEGVGN